MDLTRELELIRESLRSVTHLTRKDLTSLRKTQETIAKNLRNQHIKDSLHKLFKSFHPGPEIFNLLIPFLKSNKLKLTIPDSLIYLPALPYPAYLTTGPDGYIQMDTSKHSVDNFFSKSVPSSFPQPKFIHIAMGQRISLCYSIQEAQKIFEDCPHFSHRLHRWVPFNYPHASKLRVHWKLSKPSSGFIFTNKAQMSTKIVDREGRSDLPVLKKYVQEKSALMHKNVMDVSKFCSTGESDGMDVKRFLVQFSSGVNFGVIKTNRYLIELQEEFQALASVVNLVYFKNPNRLREMLLDFVKGESGWVFIGCKGHKVKGDLRVRFFQKVEKDQSVNSSIVRRPSAVAFESVTEESLKSDETFDSVIEENEEIERTAKRLEAQAAEMKKSHSQIIGSLSTKSYLELRQSDNLGRIPHIMIGLMPHKLENSISYFVEKEKSQKNSLEKIKNKEKLLWVGDSILNPNTHTKLTSKCLNDVAKVYTKHRLEAQIGRMNLIDRRILSEVFKKNDGELQRVLKEVISCHELVFSRYFENKSDADLSFLAKKKLDCINCSGDYFIKKNIRSVHEGLNITEADFEALIKVFETEVRRRISMNEEEYVTLFKKFRSFKSDVLNE